MSTAHYKTKDTGLWSQIANHKDRTLADEFMLSILTLEIT